MVSICWAFLYHKFGKNFIKSYDGSDYVAVLTKTMIAYCLTIWISTMAYSSKLCSWMLALGLATVKFSINRNRELLILQDISIPLKYSAWLQWGGLSLLKKNGFIYLNPPILPRFTPHPLSVRHPDAQPFRPLSCHHPLPPHVTFHAFSHFII